MTSGNNSTAASAGTYTCFCGFSINSYIYVNNAIVAALHVLFAIFAVVSNAVVILTVIRTTSLHRPANILLSSLAFGDFLVGAVAQPVMVSLHLMHNAGVSCCLYNKVYVIYLYVIPMIVCGSFVQVCVMCWDRYKAVSSPLTYRTTVTNKKMITMTVTAWIAWVTCIILLKIIPKVAKGLLVSLALASFIIICVVSQVVTLKAMRRHNNQIAAAANIDTFAREKKMAITLRWILGSIVLSVLPQLVFSVTYAVSGTNQTVGRVLASPWVKLALCLSSSLNPVVYFWRHDNMRSAAVSLIGC